MPPKGSKRKAPADAAAAGAVPGAEGAAGPGVKKAVKKKRHQSYGSFIYKILKQVHKKMRITEQAMHIMESCVTDTFERIATEASKLMRMTGKDTLTAKEIQSAVRLVLPGELSRHALGEGNKSIMTLHESKGIAGKE
uniref:Histone H2B.2 n=1 Tax=Crypthecodinium cohnii TaxID=2866 RepID=A0A6N0X420_CRYCO|nr:histone H2B.2 [Crypthecodinium cohnii]